MYADCGKETFMMVSQHNCIFTAIYGSAGNNHLPDALVKRTLQHLLSILIEGVMGQVQAYIDECFPGCS